ncbi:MAG: TetR/AcrR family transcriptional regulator [Pseudonocardiales bacterium]|nr:TetR/AcrR family transcriptional regulator [Pseudonocardiales bacterium]
MTSAVHPRPQHPTPRTAAPTVTGAGSVDHCEGPRRRGEVLCSAILEATLDELREVGYAGLRIQHVAARARASKGSIYRRWPRRADLVADAIEHAFPRRIQPPDTGSVRADLLGFLQQMADRLNSPAGEAIRGLTADTIRDPELMNAIRARFLDPTISELIGIMTRGVARGEVRPSALTTRIASIAPELLREHFLIHHCIPDRILIEILDDVVMPLIRA